MIPKSLLSTHRGYDKKALPAARLIAKITCAPLFYGRWSRLLVDLNRSPGHKNQFSAYIDSALHGEIKKRYYDPFRTMVDKAMVDSTLHLSIHSFTPILREVKRNADVGVLYDPSIKEETEIATAIKKGLSGFLVRSNYPYSGIGDGHVTSLRKRYRKYAGIEIEINQKLQIEKVREIARSIARTCEMFLC